jgi:predicted RND superfamily exporter protein
MSRLRWLWLLLLVPVAFGLARLRFDVEILDLLPGDSPVVQGLKLYQRNFSNARELVITIAAPSAEQAETTARQLAGTLKADARINAVITWQPPWQERPEQSTELIAALWLNQPPDQVAELTRRLAPDNLRPLLAGARERLATSFSAQDIGRTAYDPYGLMQLPAAASTGSGMFGDGQQLFASDDGRFRLVFVQARDDLKSYKECVKWLASVQAVVATWREREGLPAEVRIEFTGRPAFVAEIGGGMERDLAGPSLGTLAVIALLFYLAHRRIVPLLWLIALLVGTLAVTLALGGLVFGTLNVVSLGFASILLGLAEDFGIVLYQESRSHPELSVAEVRRLAMPGILWSALTCCGAFALLNLSGLPGLAQLGSLVACGVGVAAVVMLLFYLPPLCRNRPSALPRDASHSVVEARMTHPLPSRRAWFLTGAALMAALVALVVRPPAFDRSPDALKPKHSRAYAAVEEIKRRMASPAEPVWVLVEGRDEAEVARRLAVVEPALLQAASNRLIASFNLPTSLWPEPRHQAQNRPLLQSLVSRREELLRVAKAEGFTDNALVMTRAMFAAWDRALAQPGVHWPTNDASRWVLDKVFVRRPVELLALGMVYPQGKQRAVAGELFASLTAALPTEGVRVSGWELLGPTMAERVLDELPTVFLPILALVTLTLWLAFRSFKEMLLSLAAQVFSFLLLLLVMGVAGWRWNMMNLMALPLLLGMGVDFAVHTQLALRRHGGDTAAVRGSIGRALLLAGSTTVAGFGALMVSSNAGLSSLGKVCGVGILCALVTSVFLLPAWWTSLIGQTAKFPGENSSGSDRAPSRFYGPGAWRLALCCVRVLPAPVASGFARSLAVLYRVCAPRRCAIVVENLLPVFDGDRAAAEHAARRLFSQFARKLCDLWRYEGGASVNDLFGELTGWEHFQAAQSRGRGVLLVTPHLGNWEFGAPLLARRGVKLLVVTLAEPGEGLTAMRQAARARWGIETLVIGDNPFAFVEIIQRLETGATVALLMDRPPAASSVPVELFGRPFCASVAAAELARASGCALLPVYLPRVGDRYAAHIRPEVAYDRRALGDRDARRALTQQIMRAFEPAIRQHPDQWYHFVPVWSR